MRTSRLKLAAFAATLFVVGAGCSYAAEGGAGFYLLGSKGPAAGVTPPPGTYFQNDLYFYKGDLGGNRQLPTGGNVIAGVTGKAAIEIPTFIWVTPAEILGGHLGFSASLPFGYKDVSADLAISSPRFGGRSRGIDDDVFTLGDPLASSFIGWTTGDLHIQSGVLVNIPIGDYQDGELANIAFHHWGADIYTAASYIDPTTGLDFSGTIGMTFNAENPATNYRTGDEFHAEWAISKSFSPQFSAGLVGYYYDQVTGDSGSGAVLGPFKGRVAAIGATVGYNFEVGGTPVAARVKYYHEFAAENRSEGDAVFLTVSVPLGFKKPAKQVADAQ